MAETPRVRILKRLKAVLEHADLATAAGLASLSIRHYRNRETNPEERPCIAIRLTDDASNSEDGRQPSMNEVEHALEIDLVIDCEIQPEDSDLDPTGFERLGQIGIVAMKVLLDQDAEDVDGNRLFDVCDRVEDMGVAPDEDSEADEGRFIHRINVVYRTAVDDPSMLLAAGENYV